MPKLFSRSDRLVVDVTFDARWFGMMYCTAILAHGGGLPPYHVHIGLNSPKVVLETSLQF